MDFKGFFTSIFSGLIESKHAEDRWDICSECKFLIKKTNRCSDCGCFMKAKVKLRKATCPKGVW